MVDYMNYCHHFINRHGKWAIACNTRAAFPSISLRKREVNCPRCLGNTLAFEKHEHKEEPVLFAPRTFIFPFPPSQNHALLTGKDGRRHLSREVRDYRQAVAKACIVYRSPHFEGPVSLKIDLYPPLCDGAKDPDNCLKQFFDALVKAEMIDDDDGRIIRQFTVEWHDPGECPRVVLHVWRYIPGEVLDNLSLKSTDG